MFLCKLLDDNHLLMTELDSFRSSIVFCLFSMVEMATLQHTLIEDYQQGWPIDVFFSTYRSM